MLVQALLATIFALTWVVDLLRRQKYKPPKGYRLPPGPPGKPVIGHFFQLSELLQPKRMREWKEKYGDIISIDSFGIPIILIYSDEIARELLEKRGATYSDRPPSHIAELIGWEFNIGLYRYGDWWRRHIKVFKQDFNSRAVSKFEPIQMKSSRLLLQDLLETPADFSEHIQFGVGRMVVDMIYGINIKRKDDKFVDNIRLAMEALGQILLPSEWLVDIFPTMKIISHWIPGITAHKFINDYKQAIWDSYTIPFNIVKNRKTLDHSFVSRSLEKLQNSGDSSPVSERIIQNIAGTAYGAAVGTTSTTVLQAIVASLLYPETQKKVQAELDQVLGDRLPTLADRADLPYVGAFCHEVMRWRPGVPLGVAHAALEDDIYGEYFIPKGSIIFADSWQMLHGSKYGPNPEDFRPERFFQPGVNPPTAQFGFGRRICPGRFFAENALFLFIASIFKVFDIKPMKDESGIDIPVSDEITESCLPFPVPFQCSITPRSLRAKDIILGSE